MLQKKMQKKHKSVIDMKNKEKALVYVVEKKNKKSIKSVIDIKKRTKKLMKRNKWQK